MEIAIFYVPCSSAEEASGLIKKLLADKVIACGNIISAQSIYLWQGSPQDDKEWIAVMKTLPEFLETVQVKVQTMHSYDIPAIIHWNVQCNSSYYQWIESCLSK